MKIGIHTPELTTLIFNRLVASTNLPFEDCSYGNDETDSFHLELSVLPHKFIEVYVPNLEMGWTDYLVKNEEDEELLIAEDLEQVIGYFKTLTID